MEQRITRWQDGVCVEVIDTRTVAGTLARKVEAIKAAAGERILALCPEWKQRNLTARAAELAAIGSANWTPEQAAEWAAGQALWDAIKAIRAASDAAEATVRGIADGAAGADDHDACNAIEALPL